MQYTKKINGFECRAYTNPESDALFIELHYASFYHVKPYNEISFEHVNNAFDVMTKKHRAIIAYITLMELLPMTVKHLYEEDIKALRLALNIFCDCPRCGQPLASITLYPCTKCGKEFKR